MFHHISQPECEIAEDREFVSGEWKQQRNSRKDDRFDSSIGNRLGTLAPLRIVPGRFTKITRFLAKEETAT